MGGGGDVTSSCPMKGAEERRSSRIVPSGGGEEGRGDEVSLSLKETMRTGQSDYKIA